MMKRTSGVLAALLASALFLSGCAGTGAGTGSGTDVFLGSPEAEATATATAEPAPSVIPGDEDGDGKLSEFEKQVQAKKTPRDYTLPDGTVVQIDPAVPLPTPVVEALRQAVRPAVDAVFAVSSREGPTTSARLQDLQALLDVQAAATGKSIIVAHRINSADGVIWGATRSGGSTVSFRSSSDKTTLIDRATRWANDRGYELIVFD
ncbi:hypothetical protein [Mycetocola zhujimingii]|uniref:Uncharacterized protein n=1 Tax=Mycetocola zhujimingii TaxID=2079792 RepID=A0A2U1TGV6_9MICO|nr:hypothetical protein [Mycetocola zhujimingii]PWC08122.1 hypothetical protein DF223_01845 [Mycetocola zhujimingii]